MADTTTQPSPDDAEDRALVAAIQGGDSSAWEPLIERYQHRLYSVCVRMVGDKEWGRDLAQDAFVKIIQGLDSYDGRAKVSTWMIRVTMNSCISALRAAKLRRHPSLDAPVAGGTPGTTLTTTREQSREPDPTSGVRHREEQEILSQALLEIEPHQRAILLLRDSRGLDYDQIAQVLDVPVGTVKSRIFRARAALRDVIEALESPDSKPSDDRTDHA